MWNKRCVEEVGGFRIHYCSHRLGDGRPSMGSGLYTVLFLLLLSCVTMEEYSNQLLSSAGSYSAAVWRRRCEGPVHLKALPHRQVMRLYSQQPRSCLCFVDKPTWLPLITDTDRLFIERGLKSGDQPRGTMTEEKDDRKNTCHFYYCLL